ncbi:MAG: UDP-glucose--hexose-1-phosphate uridylyltransferase [Desulfobacteraceae bacterium]|jgi:UDPglucose--hexose-1-phosphate uridylyltransferase
MFTHPHRRYNILTGEWILVSPQRTQRPWQGHKEDIQRIASTAHDPDCPLCPGNMRGNGRHNPDFNGTFIFNNDFPALLENNPEEKINIQNLLIAKAEKGLCRVMCYSPRHDLTLASLKVDTIYQVVTTWVNEYQRLSELPNINHVQIFENKGIAMGASNPHPHCQIWATKSIPVEPTKEIHACREYLHAKNSCLLCDYLELEIQENQRIVDQNEDFVVIVPFWATWPFETLLLPRRHVAAIPELTHQQRLDLARMLKKLAIRYDNLFETDFPYSMGLHQQPTDGNSYSELHFHFHFYPPLLRSANVRKFMVGYEMLAEAQRDITPEAAAAILRNLSVTHYLTR